MTNSTFKIGLLGLGVMGRQHLESARSVPGVEMVTRQTPPFDTLPLDNTVLCAAMIADPTVDAIDICLPTPLHAPLSIAALAAGKHVLCEKPMALDAAECARMLVAAQASRGVLMVAHVLRFWPAYRFLREVVACRAYGAIESLSLTRKSGLPTRAPWLLRPEESGGAILDMLVHDFDQALLLCGPPERAAARTVGSPNVLECSLKYARGFEIAIAGGWHEGEVPFGMGFVLRSSGGELRYEGKHLRLSRASLPDEEIPLSAVDPYTAQLAYFVECCRSGQAPLVCPPESSARAVELACAVSGLALQGDGTEQPITLKVGGVPFLD
jgi:predicted dehydrogenase